MKAVDQRRAWMTGGGTSGELMRSIDWARTPVGPVETWSQSLKSTIGILLHSRHPMFLWWGPELVQFYNDGYLPSFGRGKHPAAMGQRGRDCWQEIWPIIWPQIDDVMTRGLPSWNEDALVPIFRNGRIEEVYWTYGYSPVFDDDGRVGGTLVVCTETTSRVVSARRLQSYSLLSERTALATDEDALLRAAAEVFGSAPDDIPFALVYAAAAAGGAPALVATAGSLPEQAPAALDGETARRLMADARSAPVKVPAGSGAVAEAFATPLVNRAGQRPNGLVVFGLSPRLPFDAAYREYLEQLATSVGQAHARIDAFRVRAAIESERNNLLVQAPVATALLTGPDHVFQLANPRFRDAVGGGRELLGRTYLQAFPELAGTALAGILDGVYRTGEPFVAEEYQVSLDRRGGGASEELFFKFNLEAIRDAGGNVYGMMAVAVDITEQVRARRVLEKANAEREKLLADLEAASRAKDEFLAMLGHELRNPLSPILTALQLMRLRGDTQTAREQEIIHRQVQHLVRLVDDLLDVAKITRGKVQLKKEVVEIAEVIAKAVEIASVLLEQRRHRLTIDVARSGLRWEGDPVRLAQVVANLLTNAARYTDPGGDILLRAGRDGGDLVVSVRDNGAGIAPDLLPQIFDLFVQGRRELDRAEGGLGLGLTLAKSLVSLHGGTITASSEGPGCGSEFVIRLPVAAGLADAARTPARAVTTPGAADGGGVAPARRILIVDDNVDSADLLAEAMRENGHEVAVANDPIAALSTFARFRPEIAILDIGLPVMSGYDLAGRLRAGGRANECRFIALTGYGQEHDQARSAEAGFARHLVKPVDFDDLMRIIDAQ